MEKKTTDWHIGDSVNTDEDIHALLKAEREPYEKALRLALIILGDIGDMTDDEMLVHDPRYYAKHWRKIILMRLKKEGINDPTELKDEKNESNI